MRRKRKEGAEQDFELALAPIIDSFVVLIAFMLISASFLSIGILDAGVAASGEISSNEKGPAVSVTVKLNPNGVMKINLSGASSITHNVGAQKDGTYDFEGLDKKLGSIKKTWPKLSAATLVASDAVNYKVVIQAMEATRKTLPFVVLGGF
jgi:biopolymer transport protein ExbD